MSLAEDLTSPPPMGHNMPPSFAEFLADRYADMLAEADRIADRAASLPSKIDNDVVLGRFGDVSKDASKLKTKLDDARKAEVEPHLTARRETNGFFNARKDGLSRVVSSLEERATDYQRAKAAEERRVREEQARKAREEEERQRRIAQEAAAKNRAAAALRHEDRADEAAERARRAEAAAQASAADLTRVRSETGTVATTRTSWDFEITDYTAVPLEALRPYIARADLEKAIRSFVRVNKDGVPLAGVRIFPNSKAAFR